MNKKRLMFELSYIEDDDEVYFCYDQYDQYDHEHHMVVLPVEMALTRKVRDNEHTQSLCLEPENNHYYEFEEYAEDEEIKEVFVISGYID